MDERQLLSARMVAALMDLEKAKEAMAAYSPQATAMASTWGSLNNRLATHLTVIGSLLEALAGPQEVATSWAHFAELQDELKSTTKEILALVQGGPLRDGEQGGGIYALADALLREVAADLGRPWAGITLPGEREQLTTRSSIIHLTFPQVSVWDLPIVLHEYGHEVAPEIRNELGQSPFQLMRGVAGSAVERSHLAELFADSFATCVCGPAFACTLVVLRFDPTAEEATRDSLTHPSYARRVALALRVLEERKKEIEDAAWAALIDELAVTWRSSLELSRPGSGVDEPVIAPATASARDPVSKLLAILDLVPQVSYRSWGRTKRLVPLLAGSGAQIGLEEGITIRDALNAAWLARLRSPDDWYAIGNRAERLIRSLATGPPRSAPAPSAGHGGSALDR